MTEQEQKKTLISKYQNKMHKTSKKKKKTICQRETT